MQLAHKSGPTDVLWKWGGRCPLGPLAQFPQSILPKLKGGLVHGFKVEFAAVFQARWPARCHRFGTCIEFERVWSVLV